MPHNLWREVWILLSIAAVSLLVSEITGHPFLIASFGFGLYIVHDVETDAVVGRALLRHLDVDGVDEVELGYALYPEWRRRGLATEIARAWMNVGRRQLGLASLVAVTLPENRGSRAVMTKVGMTYERDFTHAGLTHVLYRGA